MKERLKNLKVGEKLKKSYFTILAAFVVTLLVALVGIGSMNAMQKSFYEKAYKNTKLQMEIRKDIQMVGKNVLWAVTMEDEKKAQEKAQAQAHAEKIKALSVTIKTKAGDGGKIFGSITSKDIAEALKEQHKITVDKKKIQLANPIKMTGELDVAIKLYPEVSTTLKVIIVAG